MAEKELSIRLKAIGGDQVRKEFANVGKEGKGAFDDIRKSAKPASAGLEAVNTSAKALNNVFKQAGILVGAYVGLSSLSNSFSFILSTNREFERLNASLKTVTGSVEAAEAAFAMIEDFAATTPYSVEQVANAFIRLKGLGLDPTMESLESYGNTSAALGENITKFVEAVADATTGEFERLKEFNIKASREAENVAFTFQGTTTTIANNATAIEEYLQSIGNTAFAGALEEQMGTLNGAFSNFQDTLAGLARDVGMAGLNDAIKDVVLQFGELVGSGDEAAEAIGKGLAAAVRTAGAALGFLIENGETIINVITGFVVARTAAAAFTVLQGAMVLTTASIGAMGTAAGVTTAAMGALSRVVAVLGGPVGAIAAAGVAVYQLVDAFWGSSESSELATQMLEKYGSELDSASSTADSSKRSFYDLVESFADLDEVARNEALTHWSSELSIANADAKLMHGSIVQLISDHGDLEDALEDNVSGLEGLITNFTQGRISAQQFQKELAQIGKTNDDVMDFVEDVQTELKALSAVQNSVQNAQEAINALEIEPIVISAEVIQPEPIIPTIDEQAIQKVEEYIFQLETEIEATRRLADARNISSDALAHATLVNEQNQAIQKLGIDLTAEEDSLQGQFAVRIRELISEKNALAEADRMSQEVNKQHQASVQAISNAYLDLGTETEKAIAKADAWKVSTLAGLDETRSSYAHYAAQVEDIHARMLVDARAKDQESLNSWQGAIVNGFATVIEQGDTMAGQLEKMTANAFRNMEDAIVDFVVTGELNFSNLVDSILRDLARIVVRETVTEPLGNALSGAITAVGTAIGGPVGGLIGSGISTVGSWIGSWFSHSGGIIGDDRLKPAIASVDSFDNAPRYHSGGIIGREVPIIAQEGEGVFTPGQMRALGASIGQPIMTPKTEINIYNNAPRVKATATTRETEGGQMRIDVLIEQIEGFIGQNIVKGTGLAPAIERKYGLNAARGSFR